MNRKVCFLSIVLIMALAGAGAGAGSSAGATARTAMAVLKQTDPWTPAQLMEPSDLAAGLKDIAANPPLIVCVGPSGVIKGSVETGPARDAKNLDSLQRLLKREDRQREVIIYCGCCPFKNCPNVRPAFSLLLTMGFKQPRLLDLSHNIKVDWIDKGYPVTSR
jgi:thiosulfate/3-mercaptopyruvate sulfurtransferase